MAYLGNSPVLSQQEYRNIDNISGSFNGVTTSFALLVNGVAPVPAPQSSNQCLISVNGVVQKPDDTGASGFRISGGNIIFSSAPTGGQSFFGVILAGADYIYAGENFPDGTVSAPSITFAQDTDTGFFRSGAGEIKYTANGTAVVTLSSNNLTAPSFIPTSSSAPTNGVYLPAANSVAISTNGTQRLLIGSSGTISAGGGISGAGGLNVSGGGWGVLPYVANSLVIDSTAGQTRLFATGTDASTHGNLLFFTGTTNGTASERMRLTSTGLGVGTSSPSYTLDVTGSARITSASPMWLGTTTGDAYIQYGASATTANNWTVGSQADGSFRFFNGTYSSGTERLRITSAGNVGIGSTTPGSPLHVTGSGIIAQFLNTQNSTGEGIGLGAGTNIGRITSNGAACNLVFEINGTERARLDTSGRFGIGVTPSYKLHVDNGTTTDAAYLGNGYGGLVFGCNSSGERIINTNASGPIVFQRGGTETARIDGSSRLLVGTSSWSSTEKFVVRGNAINDNEAFLALIRGTSPGSGDNLGMISFYGNGTNEAARVTALRDGGTWTSGSSHPSRLTFSTTADGASSPTERLRITSTGALSPGSTGSNTGTTGQSLISQGSSASPTWGSSIVSGTSVASTSGTSIDFTGIPSWVKRITVMLRGVSTNGSSALQIQIGAGSITSSGYLGYAMRNGSAPSNVYTSMSAGFVLSDSLASATTRYGIFVIANVASNDWNLSGSNTSSAGVGDTSTVNGGVSLSGTLDRVRITTVNGTDTFDAGSINILYE